MKYIQHVELDQDGNELKFAYEVYLMCQVCKCVIQLASKGSRSSMIVQVEWVAAPTIDAWVAAGGIGCSVLPHRRLLVGLCKLCPLFSYYSQIIL